MSLNFLVFEVLTHPKICIVLNNHQYLPGNGSKIFLVPKNFGSKNFCVKNVLCKKIKDQNFFGSKRFESEIFCLKKQVGLTQGGGYMIPPPLENGRVKSLLGRS